MEQSLCWLFLSSIWPRNGHPELQTQVPALGRCLNWKERLTVGDWWHRRCLKVAVVKPGCLSSIPGSQVKPGENWFTDVTSDLHTWALTCVHGHTYTYNNKKINKRFTPIMQSVRWCFSQRLEQKGVESKVHILLISAVPWLHDNMTPRPALNLLVSSLPGSLILSECLGHGNYEYYKFKNGLCLILGRLRQGYSVFHACLSHTAQGLTRLGE